MPLGPLELHRLISFPLRSSLLGSLNGLREAGQCHSTRFAGLRREGGVESGIALVQICKQTFMNFYTAKMNAPLIIIVSSIVNNRRRREVSTDGLQSAKYYIFVPIFLILIQLLRLIDSKHAHDIYQLSETYMVFTFSFYRQL